MSSHRSVATADRTLARRSVLRAHILAALGVAGCSQVPQPMKPTVDGILYDRIDKDGDGSMAGIDCNDADPSIHPDAVEQCNDIDDDCDGEIDEEVRAVYYRDADGDTFGSPTNIIAACSLPDGYVENDWDCNDRAAAANPDGTEVCDGLDNDCDGNTDDIPGFWPDEDGDGYGSSGEPASECAPMPEGYAPNQADCNDADPDIYPGAPEVCLDRQDNNCDGVLSCVVVDLAIVDADEACTVTWQMEDAETTDWNYPCEGCDFTFRSQLVVSTITGDSALCDSAGSVWNDFQMQGSDFRGTADTFYPVNWYTTGDWDSGIFTWYADPATWALGDGVYASLSYMGELNVDEVQEYYYGYYGYYEGRPLSVDGNHRVAETTDRSDWRAADFSVQSGELSAADRERAVAAWTRAGLAEHASVASFNRFVMELMALGAPPSLLMESLAAAGDEVVHARDCFSVASALSGTDVGPGRLAVDGILDDTTPEGILTRLLTEGCVEETVSTSLAALRLAHTTDPSIRKVLERIVADETRHAALAWRSARWILSTRPDLMPLARAVLGEAIGRPTPSEGPAVSSALRAHGVLSRADQARERQRTLRDVVAPAVDALFAGLEPASGLSARA